MNEFDFIKSVQQKNYKQQGLIKGVGDDAAVYRQPYQDTVTSVDTFVENIHFTRKTMQPYHIGYRLLAANISDMAAMGCIPAYYLVSIVIPKGWSESELKAIYHGMSEIASYYKMDLIGGDTVSGQELVVSVTIIGFVERGKARYRHTAANGDVIFVTGTLGDSAAGFHILTNVKEKEQDKYQYFIDRHRMPSPRVAFSRELTKLIRLSLNDISDGIANEADEIAQASKVSMHLIDRQIPVHPELHNFSSKLQQKWKLFGGEDFELIGTVSEKDWPIVVEASIATNTKVTKIGYVTDDVKTNGSVYLHTNNTISKLTKSGYTHLK